MRRYPVWDIRHSQPYDSLLEALLASRGLSWADLAIDPENLHPPELLTDLERGVARLEAAIRKGERIAVFGDYDADGITSTALLLDFLEQAGADCSYLLPDRHRDGYGIRPAAVQQVAAQGAGVIATVDNGVSAFEALELARSLGIDVVVIDHHQPQEQLPPAHSLINPNRRDCAYPFKGLAGVGVTFKVVQALSQGFMEGDQRRRYLNGLLDLVALGTVADVMPVLGENRVLIHRGLKAMAQTTRPGLRQLKVAAGCGDRPLTTSVVGFQLAPRLNVAGRLASPELALRLLRAKSDSEAMVLAGELNSLNSRRQQLQRAAFREAEGLVSPEELDAERILVVLGETWELGVIGLIAGKLAERFARPAVVCTEAGEQGLYVGSARSIPGYDIGAAVSACATHLTTYGGHSGAAGFSLAPAAFESFRAALIDHAQAHLSAEDLQARLQVDLVIQPRDLGLQTLEALSRLEPFGNGNQAPVFALRDCRLKRCDRIGKEGAHLKLGLEVGGQSCTAVWWNQGEVAAQLGVGQPLAAAFELEEDTYAGRGGVQLVLKDLSPSPI
ncbi:MAG: single-stranded-DNA-specific exonuclease RecJ [Candidatus Latescibacteria bacterium]|nr:single-stranded-DNA-specific exonuclease RecJ [Candidatus Latescibacterota bacterium]